MIDVPPLAIIQARMNSRRLPGKMLMDLCGQPLVKYAFDAAAEAFDEHVVFTIPKKRVNQPLIDYVEDELDAVVRLWDGDEADVLGRFYDVANYYRWHPESIIVRVTPDDPYKNAVCLAAVAQGIRMPVELGGEAFTLGQLNEAHDVHGDSDARYREHITNALFDVPPPTMTSQGIWTIDTEAQLDAVRRQMGGGREN